MPLRNRTTARTLAVFAGVVLLALAAFGAILSLENRADASRDAEVKLAKVQSDFNVLQGLPWKTNRQAGGTPALARMWMQGSERSIEGTLTTLHRVSRTSKLDALSAPMHSNFATLERMRVLSAANKLMQAGMLANVAARSQDAALRALNAASVDYRHRASSTLTKAKVGSAAVVFLLLAGFGFFYWRSVKARSIAERLARENEQLLEASRTEAITDPLTGLGNRRALMRDLEEQLRRTSEGAHSALALFDLDGFKQYNDSFGHPAGDALLVRLAGQLEKELTGVATAYRMGGDEFCILAGVDGEDVDELAHRAAVALSGRGEGFEVGCSFGAVRLPQEAHEPAEALRLADQRMYEQKASGRTSASRQSKDVLLKVLNERNADLGGHTDDVARLSALMTERLSLSEHDCRTVRLAAELHDVGKAAIPDAILNKPGKLDDAEWEFMRRHTLIGERIVSAAPSLAGVAKLVRASHERFDGKGYPDGLRGEEIPLGARIIFVCDAFDAMVSQRPYHPAVSVEDALAELLRCAGTQFDPEIVDVFRGLVETLDASQLTRAA